jgi:NADH dehydrogenase FAD-containing subunit
MIVSSATGGALAPAEIAAPLRVILKRQPNVRVVMGEVRGFDLDARRVIVDPLPEDEEAMTFPYDTLIVAGGSRYSYFGHDEWRQFAHEIKSLESVVEVRQRIFAGVRERRARTGSRAPRGVADVRGRRGRPDRGRDGRTDRRARPRHIAPQLPLR